MFGSIILDVAIGLTFVFLLLSLIATAIQEGIQTILRSRAAQLELGIRELLNDREGVGLARAFYEHPLIRNLYRGEYTPGKPSSFRRRRGADLPSYIPARNFAVALLDMVARGPDTRDDAAASPAAPEISLEGVRIAIHRIQNPPVQRALLAAIDMAEGDLQRARENVEDWFDSSMDRVSGWYKRNTQRFLLVTGYVLAVVANADTIAIARHLYRDTAARDAMVAQARAYVPASSRSSATTADTGSIPATGNIALAYSSDRTHPIRLVPDSTPQATDTTRTRESLEQLIATLESLPLGERRTFAFPWNTANEWGDFFLPLIGWLMTALAISLGAPLWFDVLNKFIVIRSTVKPKEKSPEEASEDRQQPRSRETAERDDGEEKSSRRSPSGGQGTGGAAAIAADKFTQQQWTTGPDPDEGVL